MVVTATLAGVASPESTAPLQPILPVLVAGLVFTAFYGFSFGDISAREISTPLVVSLVCLYLVVPAALYPVAAVVLSGDLLLGVLIALSAPLAAGSSIIWTRLGGGNTLLATVTVLVSMLLAPLAMPAIITVFAGSAVDISVTEMVVELAVIIAGGGVLAFLVPDGSVSDEQLDAFSLATIGALIYVGVGGSPLSIDALQIAFVAAIAVATLGISAGFAYGLYARGIGSDDCVTVLFASSMKNLSVSVMVGAVFGGGVVVAGITAFHVVQQLVCSSLVQRLNSITATKSSEAVTPGQFGD